MKKLYNIHIIWVLLILLTLSTYTMGYLHTSGILVMSVLITTAFIKGIFIIREFMELRDVSLLWQLLMYGWLSLVCVAIMISYCIAT